MNMITLKRSTLLADVASRSTPIVAPTVARTITRVGSDEVSIEDDSNTVLDEWSATSDPDSGSTISEDSLIQEEVKKSKPKAMPPTTSGVSALKQIQSALMTLGYDLGAKYGADGKIGPYTRGAIVKFKKDHSISPANATITADFRKALAAATAPGKTPTASAAGSGSGTLVFIGAFLISAAAIYFFVK
jgi:hypothetical protein